MRVLILFFIAVILYNIGNGIKDIGTAISNRNHRTEAVIDSLRRECGNFESYVILLKERDSIQTETITRLNKRHGKRKK